MAEYVKNTKYAKTGRMSLRGVYSLNCADESCKKKSMQMAELPSRYDAYVPLNTLDLSNDSDTCPQNPSDSTCL